MAYCPSGELWLQTLPWDLAETCEPSLSGFAKEADTWVSFRQIHLALQEGGCP